VGISAKPIRSLLFVPGNREDRMRKAVSYGADALVFDLEGSVPQAELPTARAMVRSVLADRAGGRPQMFVRVGAARAGDIEADLGAIVGQQLDGILLPQVEDRHDVELVDTMLTKAEERAGVEPGRTILVPLMETAEAVRTAFDIARCSARVAHMGGGISKQGDIARAIGYRWTPEGFETLYLRSKVLLDMRAARIAYPLSGMWGTIGDLDGLRTFADHTRDLGYSGMMCIHPSHVPVINEVFTPTAAEVAQWQRIIRSMADATEQGVGVIDLGGEIVDHAHVLTARQGLAFASELGIVPADLS
jgi:citrate lyase subunit beta/citryl-CoA lyase